MFTGTHSNRQKSLVAAVSLALGTALAPQTSSATVFTFNWTGYFTMLDSTGAALGNTSITAKGANTYQTPISGTLVYDDATHSGTMTINQFDFFSGTAPAVASGITLSDTDGAGAGTLLLGNMLFDWNGNNGIPVSIVWDGAGLLTYLSGTPTVGDTLSNAGAAPASDGTYTNAIFQYLALGATPVATTEWNTTLAAGCSIGADADFTNNAGGGCMGVNPSGALPLLVDNAVNNNEYAMGDGVGIGGNPMADGPFQGFNANFDLTELTLVSDGSGPAFTTPADVTETIAESATPTTTIIDIGTVGDEPGGTTVEYSIDGGSTWVADTGAANNVTFDLAETVNTFQVEWRVYVTADPASVTLDSQTVTVTITDTTAPAFTSLPADITVSVGSTAETVSFEGPTSPAGSIAATDATDPAPLIEWSLDNLNWTAETAGADETSNDFGAGANTVYWRVTDATGNPSTYQQTVTLSLPTGIVGQPCTVDPDLLNAAIGDRQLEGVFTMRDSTGAIVGTPDSYVTGTINTATVCADTSCTDSGASLSSPTPFYGNLWTTNTIRLFNLPGTYSFDTIQDGNPSLSMDVAPGQLGAHMLFDWSVNRDIDVVLVWDYGCGGAELVTTDPDGDGIIGTKMVDGPFKGFNAAFDLSTIAGEQPITTGGYTVTIPAVSNPIDNTSPLPVNPGTIGTVIGDVVITAEELSSWGAADDSSVVRSCVGGCFDFSVSGRTPGETIQVVLPLSEPIPWYSLYRKYNTGTDSWRSYTVSSTDNVMTAALNEDGSCPEPGAGDYAAYSTGILAGMLRPGDQCVQLTITDNGPNDSDPAPGVIADPSGVGVTSGPTTPEASTSGGGCAISNEAPVNQRLDLWLIAGLLGLLGLRRRLSRH